MRELQMPVLEIGMCSCKTPDCNLRVLPSSHILDIFSPSLLSPSSPWPSAPPPPSSSSQLPSPCHHYSPEKKADDNDTQTHNNEDHAPGDIVVALITDVAAFVLV